MMLFRALERNGAERAEKSPERERSGEQASQKTMERERECGAGSCGAGVERAAEVTTSA